MYPYLIQCLPYVSKYWQPEEIMWRVNRRRGRTRLPRTNKWTEASCSPCFSWGQLVPFWEQSQDGFFFFFQSALNVLDCGYLCRRLILSTEPYAAPLSVFGAPQDSTWHFAGAQWPCNEGTDRLIAAIAGISVTEQRTVFSRLFSQWIVCWGNVISSLVLPPPFFLCFFKKSFVF